MISLIRVYEKLVELKERAEEKERAAEDNKEGPSSAEAQRICTDLADRIEKLQKQAAEGVATEKP